VSNVLGISKSPFKNNGTDRLVQVIFGIGLYGNGVAKKLPGSDRYCYHPHINDPGQIVWIRSNNGIPEIYLHANGLMKKITVAVLPGTLLMNTLKSIMLDK
jgi:hypothetical protein